MDALEILDEAKNYWNAIHAAGGELLENSVGKKYLFLQGFAGGAIVDTANGDSIDEQLVALTVDIAGGFLFAFGGPIGKTIEVSLIATGHSPGDYAKDYYKTIKSDIASQYWKYEKDFFYMKAGQMLHLDYAKVLYDRNGAIFDLGDQVVQATYESQYNKYVSTKQLLLASIDSTVLNVQIENSNGVLKVTLPDGTIYAQGDETVNTLVGGTKDDYLNGGTGSDTMEGGAGNDTYIADNGDKVYDQDGIGHVEFYGMTLSGGTQMEGVANTYEGNGGVYTLNPSNKVLTFVKGFHHNHNYSYSYGYANKNIKKEETKLCI